MLQGDTLAPYLFIICLDCVLRTSIDLMKEDGFTLAKAWTITDTDYVDDIELLANTPAQAESLLHSLERVEGGIGLHVNADKTEFMFFNQSGDISTLNRSLKLVDKFTYLGSSVSSTVNDINTRLVKPWTAIGRLSVIWKLELSDKIKCSFFSSSGWVNTAVWMHHINVEETYGEKAWLLLHKNASSCIEQILEAASHKTAAVRTPTKHLENHPN